MLPPWIATRYFAGLRADDAPKDELVEQAESLLDVLGDAYLNKHLLFGVLECVVVRLMPELGERGVKALLTERLGDLDSSM